LAALFVLRDTIRLSGGQVRATQQYTEENMLTDMKLIGFLVTIDYDRAREFYEQKLGFEFVSVDQYALVMRTAKNMIRITKIKNFTPARNTVLGWEVENIEDEVRMLTQRGIEFENYPFIQDHELRIWTAPGGDKIAWFKDPDGNVLSLSTHQQLAP
jgi:catechol 2,3-dioxygenase-like lactoylglutathione lyase family enzyme